MTLQLSRLTFLLAVLTLPLVQGLPISVGSYPLQVSDGFVLLSILLWLLAAATRGTGMKTSGLLPVIAVYIGALALSALLSEAPRTSALKLAGEIYLAASAVLTFQLVADDEEMMRRTFLAWAGATLVTAVFGILAVVLFYAGFQTQETNPLLSHFGSLPAGGYPRIRSVFANANMMVNYLNIGVPLLTAAAYKGWLSRRRASGIAAAAVGTGFLALSPGFGGLMLSSSLWHFGFGRRARRLLLAAGIAGAIAFLSAALISPDTPNTDRGFTFAGRTFEPSVRVLVWQDSLRTISDNPVVGRGVGIDPASVRYVTLSGDRQFLRDAHNMFLNVAGQSGAVGLAAFVLLLVYVGRGLLRGSRSLDPVAAGLACAFAGAILFQGLTGSFENARHFWILIGLAGAAAGARRTSS